MAEEEEEPNTKGLKQLLVSNITYLWVIVDSLLRSLLSFALRIVILHEFMHAMMIRFRPGNRTPTPTQSPSINRKEAGYWVEYWLSGVGHAMFVYPTRILRNPDDPPFSFNKLRRIHFITDTEHYIEFKHMFRFKLAVEGDLF